MLLPAGDCQRTDEYLHAQDLRELERLQGRGEVCIRLKFKRGLHPFFPPQVQLLRPRFLGPVASALAAHPMLQLPKWDPWRSQSDLLENLRTFLEVTPRHPFICTYGVFSDDKEKLKSCWWLAAARRPN